MGTFKKISCLITAILFMAVSVILPCFASDTEVNLSWGSPFYMFTGYYDDLNSTMVYNQNFITGSGAPNNVSIPSSLFQSYYSGQTSSSKYLFGYGITGSILDENGILDTLHSDYSYRLIITVDYTFNFGSSNYPAPVIDNSFEFWATSNHPGDSGFPTGLFPLSDFLDNYTQSSEYIAGEDLGNGNLKQQYSYSCVFHFPSGDDVSVHPETYNFLSFFCTALNDSVNPNNGNPAPGFTQALYFSVVDFTGVYDPTGDTTDDLQTEAEQIIQGQIEAAQYALSQEQAANEAALSDALNGSDASGLDVTASFGQSLVSLYNALNYTGTSFSFNLPATGNVPFLNTQLWVDTPIPIKEYIDKVPNVVWVVLNFLLWFLVVRSAIKLVHKIIDMINGNSGGD